MSDDEKTLSSFEVEVLRALQLDCWKPNEKIAEDARKSASAVSRAIKDMTEAKIITGYHAGIDPNKLGLKNTVFTLVSLKQHGDGMTAAFERELAVMPHVVEWASISGSWDYLLKFLVRDPQHYETLRLELLSLPMVNRLRGMPVNGQPRSNPIPLD